MHHKSIVLISLIFALNSIWSCTSDKRVDKESVKQELENREIKKITEAEIVTKVHEIGNSIALNTKKTLGKNLQKALQEGGVENAISFCNINALPLVDSLNKHYNAKIKRVTLKARNPNNLPSSAEKELLEAYAFQWADSIPLQTNVQVIEENTYLFTKAILIDNALCLQCHGSMENGLSKETADFIKSKYPSDSATGYDLGDLRGMWSITIPKKVVVQSM